MGMLNISTKQYDELRRLTKKANRRIIAFTEKYEAEGLSIIPYDVTGGKVQTRSQWASSKTPLSRGKGQFVDMKEFNAHMRWLRGFDRPTMRPTVTQYEKVQRRKTELAVVTSLGSIHDNERNMIEQMSTAQLAKFWGIFDEVATDMGITYSSNSAMNQALELYKEDRDHMFNRASA